MSAAVKCKSCGLYYNSQIFFTCPHCTPATEAKVVKCQACGLFYSGQIYSVCPHCSGEISMIGNKEDFEKPIFEEKDIFDN